MRFISLDSWRGIAALAVALFHFNAAWHGYDATGQRFIHLFVDFFFVLSGLVISQAYAARLSSPPEAFSFLIRRFGRIWPLHVAVLAGFAAVEGAKWMAISRLGMAAGTPPFSETGAVPASEIITHLTMLHGIGFSGRLTWNTPSWSISTEFWIYVLFAVLSLMLPRGRTLILAALAAFAAYVLAANVTIHDLDLTHDYGLARCLLGFALGHLVYRARLFTPASPLLTRSPWAEPAVLLAIALAFLWTLGTPAIVAVVPLIAGAVYVFSYDAGPVSRLLHARPFQSLGTWSYSIYMIHGLILFAAGLAISVLERKIGHPLWQELPHATRMVRSVGNINPWLLDLALIGFLALTIWLSSWTYRLIESPARERFNGLARHLDRAPLANSVPAVGPSPKNG